MQIENTPEEIIQGIIDDNINFPPRTPEGIVIFARDVAQRYRIAASLAAKRGDTTFAIELTDKALKCDAVVRNTAL